MHEVSLAREILRILQEQARMQGFGRVHRVHLELGPLSCVDPEALIFAFEAVTADTLARGARLELHRPPARGTCRHCGHGYTMDSLVTPCPRCGGPGRILSGLEMRVRDLEVSGGHAGTSREG
ncbi:hydrogenase maturation nickel metallochaperone HypA [Ectothiorhodospira mobilis]|uniref:hydrogenase maturation nickel metallochaperone HypA n=1 Tax=Ectothiorhodospira mobilis TaxID=195064 RepID=UPI001903E816|nr:hydrogenase maturation nickel metallochaperone HypA [Ectothiorhodospira mobilis]MBK1691893.1 hydrogenase maturation nickel metallochaperone HypA [Ectothiorhodospira mobilis]